MYRALFLGLVLGSGMLWAGAPMDLDSPFIKTALIRGTSGEIVEKSVRKGRIDGGNIELQKDEGDLLVLPADRVLAVLPKIPQAGETYLQSDAQRALAVLTEAQKLFPDRVEVAVSTIAEWDKLSRQATQADGIERKALEDWFQSAAKISPQAKMDEIRALGEQGESFAVKFPNEEKRIHEQVKGLRELSKIDLSKIANPAFQIGNFGDSFVPGAILWVILVVPLIIFIVGVSGAIQGFKERLPLAGLLRLVLALIAGGLLGLVLWPAATKPGSNAENTEIHSSAQRGLWLSRNLIEQWADQPLQKVNVPSEAWLGFISGTLQAGVEDLSSLFWCLEKPRIKHENKQLLIVQPLVLKILPINLTFVFSEPSKGQSWADVDLTGFKIGRLPLGKLVGGYALQALSVGYEGVRSGFALDKGVRWVMGSDDMLVVEIPSARQKRPVAKDSVSAKELAEVFDQGFGDIYKDKYITVEGVLDEVHSTQENLGKGAIEKSDPLDEFYLTGIPGNGLKRRVRIRCQIKSQERSYFLDGKGDLYYKEYTEKVAEKTSTKKTASGTGSSSAAEKPTVQEIVKALNPNNDQSIFRKGGTVKFHGGRVESTKVEMETVTIYDCQKFEVNENGVIKILWEAKK